LFLLNKYLVLIALQVIAVSNLLLQRKNVGMKGNQNAILVRNTERSNVAVYSETNTETGETRLYCHSEQKAKKEPVSHKTTTLK
jgi:hypothetical protein